MGLDNIPGIYACELTNTDVRDKDGLIDCKSTMECGGCTFKNELDKSEFILGDSTYGIFATPCWYRGKYGNYMIDRVIESKGLLKDYNGGFYGDIDYDEDNGDQGGLSYNYCLELANEMEKVTDVWNEISMSLEPLPEQKERLKKDWRYALWWLRFTAKFADGSKVWY